MSKSRKDSLGWPPPGDEHPFDNPDDGTTIRDYKDEIDLDRILSQHEDEPFHFSEDLNFEDDEED